MPTITNLAGPVLATTADHPERLAVIGPDGRATYGELVAAAAELAAAFHGWGVRPGHHVGVVLPPGRAAITAALGALLCGAAYVTVDPIQPDAQVEAMLNQCGARIRCDADGRAGTGPHRVTGADIDAIYTRGGTAAGASLEHGDIAYIVHTSGSTGVPKGVRVPHTGLINLVADLDERAPVPAGHRGAWWTSPSFDVSLWEVWSPLLRGGAVVAVPPADRLEADRFVDFLDRTGVISAYLPPGLVRGVRDRLAADPGRCANLSRLLVGVEPLPLGLLQDLMTGRPGLRVVNGYGPAEATVCATLFTVPRTGGDPAERTPIGFPVRGNRVHLLDPDGAPTVGEAGELLIAGRGVARGYIGDVAGGFGPEPGVPDAPAYRTGDLVRRRPDGALVFEGRSDRQLKVRGHRVEAGEIEAALRRVGDFQEVIVGPRPDGTIAAYALPATGSEVDPVRIRSALRPFLPPYAIPTHVVPIAHVPQTANGKTDHRALARLDLPVHNRAATPVAGAGHPAWLSTVAAAYRGILGVPVVDFDRPFIDLGGTSIGAVQVAVRLRAETGREISAPEVLQAPSAIALAGSLEDAPAVAAVTGSGRRRGPLSAAQAGLWLHELAEPDDQRYLESVCVDIAGKLDAGRFADAVAAVARRHGVFGARVVADTGVPQWELGVRDVPVEVLDARDVTVEELLRRPFALDEGPLMRATLLVRDEVTATAVFSWHHLAVDGWSVRVFAEDLARAYAGLAVADPGRTVCDLASGPAPVDPVQVRDVLARLSGRPVTVELGPAAAEQPDGWLHLRLPTPADGELRGRTAYVHLLTAFSLAVERVFDLSGFLLATARADRDHPGAERVCGYLISTGLLPAGGLAGRPASEMLDRTAAVAAQGGRDAAVPFAVLANGLLRTVRPRPASFPQIYFSYDESPVWALGEGLTCTPRIVAGGRPKFDLTLELDRAAGSIAGRIGYRAAAVSPAAASAVAAAFTAAAAELSAAGAPRTSASPSGVRR